MMHSSKVNNSIHVYYCRNAVGSEIPSALKRLELRDDARLEAMPCGGRIDPRYLMKAFEADARAICILACPPGCCKSMEGNLRAVARVRGVRELLSEAGLDPKSVQVFMPCESGEVALNAAAEALAAFVAQQLEVSAP